MQPGHNTTETPATLWDAARTAPTVSKRGRIKKSELVQFPEFEEASQRVEDPFWRGILRKCARKKFPRGFSYVDTFLHHRANDIYIKLPDDPYALAQTAIYFFQENGKIYSKYDREVKKRQEEEQILFILSENTTNWTAVARSKNRRAAHVRDYVERKYAHLPRPIRDELYTQISTGFELGFIKKEHISFEDGHLVNVDGFDANESGVFPTRELPPFRLVPVVRKAKPKDKVYRHYEGWLKYLDDYRKYMTQTDGSSRYILTSGHSEAQYTELED